MRRSRFTDEQIVRIVKEVDAGATCAEVTRRHAIKIEDDVARRDSGEAIAIVAKQHWSASLQLAAPR